MRRLLLSIFSTLILLVPSSRRAQLVMATKDDTTPSNKTADRAENGTKDRIGLFVLERVLDSVDGALDFMDSEVDNLNLDAVIGTRLVEGQLSVLLGRLAMDGNLKIPEKFVPRLAAMMEKAERISDIAEGQVRVEQKDYYSKIGVLIARGFWRLNYSTHDLDASLRSKPRVSGEAMREVDSDDCLAELFGTSGKTTEKCRVSRRCWKMMTDTGYRYYSLTHQVFYLQIGTAFGCFAEKMQSLTIQLCSGYCTNIMTETQQIADLDYPKDDQDLFMEQAALCGMLGYRQFFRNSWLDKILGWQRFPRGCWGTELPTEIATGRFKREERVLPDGCECHRTAVALGALVQYIRFVIESLQTTA